MLHRKTKIHRTGGVANAEIALSGNIWYVPHYTPNVEKQDELSEHFLSNAPRDLPKLYYIERSVSMKEKHKTPALFNLRLVVALVFIFKSL